MRKEDRLEQEKIPPNVQIEMRKTRELGDRLYELHGKPLESEHWGRYLAVHPDGGFALDDDRESLHTRAVKELGKGYFLFKVGSRTIHNSPYSQICPEHELRVARRGPSSLIRRIVDD